MKLRQACQAAAQVVGIRILGVDAHGAPGVSLSRRTLPGTPSERVLALKHRGSRGQRQFSQRVPETLQLVGMGSR